VVQAAYKTPVASLAPVVTYLGSANEAMSFNMKYENAAGDKCLVSVLDSDGEVLFDQVFTDKKIQQDLPGAFRNGQAQLRCAQHQNQGAEKN